MAHNQSNPAPMVVVNQTQSKARSNSVSGWYGGKSLSPKFKTPYSRNKTKQLKNDIATAERINRPNLFHADIFLKKVIITFVA
jgi:hypothetical protein